MKIFGLDLFWLYIIAAMIIIIGIKYRGEISIADVFILLICWASILL